MLQVRLHVGRKRSLAIAAFIMIFSLGGAAVAYACTALATLDLSHNSAVPTQEIVATGNGFDWKPTSSPVEVRIAADDGGVVWTGQPDLLSSSFQASFNVPELSPGSYVVSASQYNAFGDPVPGTPAKAVLEVK